MLLRKVTEDTTLVHSQMAEKRDKAATNHVTTMSAQHHEIDCRVLVIFVGGSGLGKLVLQRGKGRVGRLMQMMVVRWGVER